MISTYGGVLNAIEKVLRELVKEYWEVGKFFWDLVEGQKRNMTQLERIGTTIEQRWDSERKSGKEKNKNEEEGSEKGSRESQKEGTLLSTSY